HQNAEAEKSRVDELRGDLSLERKDGSRQNFKTLGKVAVGNRGWDRQIVRREEDTHQGNVKLDGVAVPGRGQQRSGGDESEDAGCKYCDADVWPGHLRIAEPVAPHRSKLVSQFARLHPEQGQGSRE